MSTNDQINGAMMKAYLRPVGLHSRSFLRVADALERYKPSGIEIVTKLRDRNFQLLHVISYDAIEYARNLRSQGVNYAVIQYCLGTTERPDHSAWYELWHGAQIVWSYYDLSEDAKLAGFNFYHAPLGVDDVFLSHRTASVRRNRVITTGYVSGPRAEPIEEVWIAAARAGVEAVHIGPSKVEGMSTYPSNWRAISPTDKELAELYSTSRRVSGMRHVEGFELPAAEGLVCGCLPIVFDQPAMQKWYGNSVEYVEECHGEELVGKLEVIFGSSRRKETIGPAAQAAVFDWKSICDGFWSRLVLTID